MISHTVEYTRTRTHRRTPIPFTFFFFSSRGSRERSLKSRCINHSFQHRGIGGLYRVSLRQSPQVPLSLGSSSTVTRDEINHIRRFSTLSRFARRFRILITLIGAKSTTSPTDEGKSRAPVATTASQAGENSPYREVNDRGTVRAARNPTRVELAAFSGLRTDES